MPRRKQSVTMFGKSWSVVDLPNLEKAVKLFRELIDLQNNFADSLSGADKIMNQINKNSEIRNELDKLGIKLNEQQLNQVIDRLKQIGSVNTELSNQIDITRQIIDKSNQITSSNTPRYSNINRNNFGASVMGIVQEKKANKLYTQAYNNAMKIPGTTQEQAQSFAIDSAANSLSASAGKFELGASLLQTAANTFFQGVSKLSDLFTSGMNQQVSVYNSTFSNIAARTNTNRSGYYSAWSNLNNELSSRGLFENVGSAEVMQMWNTLASQGINVDLSTEQGRAEATAKAIDTVVTNKIVPYIDASSYYIQQLASEQPNFFNEIRAIGITSQEIMGSSYAANKYLQDMIDNLSPVAALASQELGVQYAKTLGIYETLKSQGYSDYSIGQYYNGMQQVYTDPYAALTGSDVQAKMAVLNTIQNGGDLSNTYDVGMGYMQALNTWSTLVPQGDRIGIGAISHSTNMAMGPIALEEASTRGIDLGLIQNNSTQMEQQLAENSDKINEKLAEDQMQTNQELQELTMQNLSNEFAMLKGFMGHYYDIIIESIKGVAGAIATSIVGKGISSLVNSGSTLTTTLSTVATQTGTTATATTALKSGALSTAGGMLLGGFTVVAGTALAAAISKGMMEADQASAKSSAEAQLEGTDLSGNTAAANIETISNLDSVNTWTDMSAMGGLLGSFANNVINTFSSDISGDNKRRYSNLLSALQQKNISNDEKKEYTAAFMLLLASKNRLSDIGVTESDLKEYLESDQGPSTINALSKIGKAPLWVYQPHDKSGKIESIDTGWFKNTLSTWNYHRQGLDYVPEDGYPAILHEGEAVLTSGTANELRSLIDEYRSTNEQSVNFESIVQQQTASLINKLEEIRQTISSTSVSTNTNNVTRGNASTLARTSMLNMRNSKQIFNN